MLDHGISGVAAIVGVAESNEVGVVPTKSALQLHAEAATNALRDAGLSMGDVDALFTAGVSTLEVGEYLGISPSYFDGTDVGGSSFVSHVGHAAAAIAAGLCEVALITHGESGRSRVGMLPSPTSSQSLKSQFEEPFGMPRAVGPYALATSRHMHQYGTTKAQLAEIAVATRKWAALNPRAMFRDPITVDDVLASPLVSYPLNLLDCCPVTDAGGAVVITRADRARDCRETPVSLLGFAEAQSHAMISQMPDLTTGPGRRSGPRALSMAGVRHDDIDVAEIYDSFTYTVLVSLEDLGFCLKGEGGDFVANQRTAPGGAFPMNTSGGGLSYTHPGMFGIFTIIEAVRQLRHEYVDQGARQVPDADVALVHGTGGVLSAAATLILGRA